MEGEYKYLVATQCMTYNHAQYIEETLRGFAMQDVHFHVVYIVVDDASTDGEQTVLKEWAAKNLIESEGNSWQEKSYGQLIVAPLKENHNSTFVIILLSENHYQKGIGSEKYRYMAEWYENAKYQSICEGDDCWTDPMKLQKQICFMESHPDYGLCYTKAKIYNQKSGSYEDNTIGWPFCSFKDMLLKNPVITLTTLFKTRLYLDYGSEIMPYSSEWRMGDYPLWLFIAAKTKIFFIDEVTADYRMSIGSFSRPLELGKKIEYIESMRDIRLFFFEKYGKGEKELEQKIHETCAHKVAQTCLECGETKKAFNYIKEYSGRINKFALYSQCIIKIIKKNVYSFYRKVFH